MPKPSLSELEYDPFSARHIGPDAADIEHMLRAVGHESLGAFADAIVPDTIKWTATLPSTEGMSETQALSRLRAMAGRNRTFRNFIGQGYYGSHTPAVILRNILENPAWYTAYTPYQAEISQGRLEALMNFQQMCTDLTGMDIANASLLDEATAAAEAMTLAKRSARSRSNLFYVADDVHPQTIDVLRTRADGLGIDLTVGVPHGAMVADCFGVLLQYPNTFGQIHDHHALVQAVHAKGGLVVVATDLLALTLIRPPGEWGADIAVGNSQRFGVPLGYGGPHAAFMACRDAYKRSMPGRLVGVSIDAKGKPAYRLTLQTREQHIRREKATSNVCTAQALLAVMSSMFAVYHGPQGLTRVARRVHRLSAILARALRGANLTVGDEFFDTVCVTGIDADAIHAEAEAAGINLRHLDSTRLGVSLDETTTREDVRALASLFRVDVDIDGLDNEPIDALPAQLLRSSAFLGHPVFNSYHSEHELLRYMRRLADKDLAMDRTMIPLGSCTMKLNATAEMLPVTWPEFAQIHPLAPASQTQGYQEMIDSLEAMLADITGYDAVSFQPNSGAQGELAGLLAIRAWHRSRGEGHRNVCLIPESAHGTNPASAQMAGMKVVVTRCDTRGNVDLDDIRAQAGKHSKSLAAIMLTYPSTHGVFEEDVVDICRIVHEHGGQVYTDGANLNALVGLARPGLWGSDISHLNLHKTFCVPHGGGGPGVGPCAAKSHLARFLPRGHATADGSVGAISGAAHGSAGILPISWMYIAMMGSSGMCRASQVAMLAANYIARRLAPYFPTLYTGRNGLVAHECILDLRPLEKTTGITAEDVAKRLMDFGFHAPTLSFPVPGTLMVEPTESESLDELERFIEAMVQIHGEIRAVEKGLLERDDNPLRNAPHTAESVMAETWTHAYSRELAAFPVSRLRDSKYWPPVARVDNVHGDKNVFCACIPVHAYETSNDA
ncbi:aminomethyl-transferring glycine dehydrogenase [Rhodanobacter denitrificans]|nr:aminomethyl-transferring glycine dehydrogenase [Rhodanobacter denitrificans]UJJ60236.1 aminomethyl-transferring glycine dehydrogenase [Rhodanobacter denitrificans]